MLHKLLPSKSCFNPNSPPVTQKKTSPRNLRDWLVHTLHVGGEINTAQATQRFEVLLTQGCKLNTQAVLWIVYFVYIKCIKSHENVLSVDNFLELQTHCSDKGRIRGWWTGQKRGLALICNSGLCEYSCSPYVCVNYETHCVPFPFPFIWGDADKYWVLPRKN